MGKGFNHSENRASVIMTLDVLITNEGKRLFILIVHQTSKLNRSFDLSTISSDMSTEGTMQEEELLGLIHHRMKRAS